MVIETAGSGTAPLSRWVIYPKMTRARGWYRAIAVDVWDGVKCCFMFWTTIPF